jgi:hypothetical protein
MYEVARAYLYRKWVMGMRPCTVGRVTATHAFNLGSPMLSPRAVFVVPVFDQVLIHTALRPQKPNCRSHSTHNFFLVSHHMYTIVKHLSACLINTDIDLMQHASLPLVVEGKLCGRLQLALAARPTAPHPALTTTCFSYRWTLKVWRL